MYIFQPNTSAKVSIRTGKQPPSPQTINKLCYLRKLFKNPRAKPDGTKMFCSAFLNDARMCCFFANAIVKY